MRHENIVTRVFSMLLAVLATLPLASAAEFSYRGFTGISPLNKIVEVMAWMFNIPILHNPTVQQGFIRFMLFLIFLAVSHFVFKKLFDKKTSGIISTAFALISAFLMPANWVNANGGVITAVYSALIPLGVVALGLWFCYKKLNKSFVTRLIAIVVLFTLLAILDVYQYALGLPILFVFSTSWLRSKLGGER